MCISRFMVCIFVLRGTLKKSFLHFSIWSFYFYTSYNSLILPAEKDKRISKSMIFCKRKT